MILVDTSVWIEVFRKPSRLQLDSVVDLRAGVTIRSGVDCLIAACALRNGLLVLHHDRDFSLLAQVSPLQERRLSQ